MRLTILTVGTPRDRRLKDLCDHYLGRCSPFWRVIWDSVSAGDPRGSRLAQRATAAEGSRLTQRLDGSGSSNTVNVAVDERGKRYTSKEFARWLGEQRDRGRGVRLIIGGAHGLAPEVIQRCTHKISLSPMTLPHELALLMLVEQLYRAKTILAGEPYHH